MLYTKYEVQVNFCFTWKDYLGPCMLEWEEVKMYVLYLMQLHWKVLRVGEK